MVSTDPAKPAAGYRRIMTEKEHESQRSLVEFSLRVCPEGGRHKGKGHEATLADHDRR